MATQSNPDSNEQNNEAVDLSLEELSTVSGGLGVAPGPFAPGPFTPGSLAIGDKSFGETLTSSGFQGMSTGMPHYPSTAATALPHNFSMNAAPSMDAAPSMNAAPSMDGVAEDWTAASDGTADNFAAGGVSAEAAADWGGER